MASPVRIGVLATIALHFFTLGAWWLQAPYPPSEPIASQAESVTTIALLKGAASDSSEPDEPKQTILPAPSHAIPDEQRLPATQETTHPISLTPALPFKDVPYIPAGELDERPFAEAPVIIPFPDASLNSPKVAGILVLYIGANGYVDRIEVDESNLPPEFEKAAIDTFLQARMRPGMKDGQPARARMKIFVEFEQQ